MSLYYTTVDVSLGNLLVAWSVRGVRFVGLFDSRMDSESTMKSRFPDRTITREQNPSEYVQSIASFLEEPNCVLDVPTDMEGTGFQKEVWSALAKIKTGETIAYSSLAATMGGVKYTRAVARACASNDIAIVVPCHRVIGKNGSMTGYRWGRERKEKLLEREKLCRR